MNIKFSFTVLLSFLLLSSVVAQKDSKPWARVYVNGKFGVISKNGTEIIKPEYDMLGNFDKDIVNVVQDTSVFRLNNLGQRMPYSPGDATKGKARPFSENSKWGLKDDKGITICNPKYHFIGKFDDGRAYTFLNGKMGLVSDKGIEIVPPIYNLIYKFEKGEAIVFKDSLCGLINEKGVEIVKPQYERIERIKGNNYLVVAKGLWGVLNENGHETIAPQYAATLPCKDGFKTFKDNKTGMLFEDGQLMFEPKYDAVSSQENGVFIVTLNGLFGLLNKKGKEILPPTYQYINKFEDNRSIILHGSLWGMINNDGVELIKPQFNAIEKTNDNCYKVITENKVGIINKDGAVIVEPKYNDVEIF